MGRAVRPKPARLASKLKQVRAALNLSQEKLVECLNYKQSLLTPSMVSEFENSKREPPVLVLLCYARTAGIPLEYLIDDELDLPEKLPCKPFQWILKG